MHDHRVKQEARITRLLADRILPAIHGPGTPLTISAHHVAGEPINVDEALSAHYEPFAVGDSWGSPWGTTWFRLEGTVPTTPTDRPMDAIVSFAPDGVPGFAAEALVWHADGSGPLQGLHPDHQRIPVSGAAGAPVSFLVEAAANPQLGWGFGPTPMGDPATAPPAPLYRLTRAEVAPRNDDAYALWLDLRVLVGLMRELPHTAPRRHQILACITRALDALDLHDVPATASRARSHLHDELAAPATTSAHQISAVGHAHIDTAWLWPLRETIRKCARTFSTAVALMDEDPHYRFACSQAQHYAWMEGHYPALFERIREKVAAGQFVPVGGMWVEADVNLTSGESIVRQLVYGQRYFSERFGIECREGWLPDVFGYSAALPQILRSGGCDRFVTQKMSWNEANRMPHHSFDWEGLDGSRVRAHFPPADTYNGSMRPAELIAAEQRFLDHGRTNRSLYLFGHGDGGGGPTREMLELAHRQADLEGVPRVALESAAVFFDRTEREDPRPPVWVGELYLEKHRGTFTTQAATKAGNRRSELALREAELWSVAAVAAGAAWPGSALDALWTTLLTRQFHDILPGSSIAWVHREAEAAFAEVIHGAEALTDAALARVAERAGPGPLVANPSTHPRSEVIVTDLDLPGSGPSQRLTDGSQGFALTAPGLAVAAAVRHDPKDRVEVTDRSIRNEALSVAWDDHGLWTSVFDRHAEREVLRGPGNRLTLFDDHPAEYDAWDIDPGYEARARSLTEVETITVIDAGPLLGRVRVTRAFGASRIMQDLVLRAGSRRIDIETRIDWHEDEKLLKVAFPVDIHAHTASYEVQFGAVQRPTHRNTSWDDARFEVCAHTWADLSEPDYGVALLNDAKYGYDIAGHVMRLTLLRAPNFPDPRADRGPHRFTYALFPHEGNWRQGGVVAEAHALNQPLRIVAGADTGSDATAGSRWAQPVVKVDHPGVIASAVKLADDGSGDLVVRLYETWGQRSRCRLTTPSPVLEARPCDLLERPVTGPDLVLEGATVRVPLRPYELVTLRLRQ